MRALVTGGAGFIGSHLVEALLRRGDRVRVLDNLFTGKESNLAPIRRRMEFIRGDIRDQKILRRALRGIDVVFHQAALRSVPKSVQDPLGYHEVNATGTLLLLALAAESGVRRVVYASSSSVYGKSPLPQRETQPTQPLSPYAASKLSGEFYCALYARSTPLETVALRYFNVFGPRQSLESEYAVVIPKFIASLLKGKPPPIYGDGKQTRDFTYIDNVIQANLKAATAPKVSGEVLNIASGGRHSVLELARTLNRMMGLSIFPTFAAPRAGDLPHSWADTSKAKRLLKYRVSVPYLKGLERTVAWFEEHPQLWRTR
jgi:UDP-glucose 4-epimerase